VPFKGVADPSLDEARRRVDGVDAPGGHRPDLRPLRGRRSDRREAGTIVVETKERQLYYVSAEPARDPLRRRGRRRGLRWTGTATVQRKAEWPDWNPPAEMKKRWPHVHPVSGGPNSPLGARALYLFEGNRDTL
jgi:lipoprotein-anchoring transpeptidase ErfK/SrfK